MQNPLVNAPNGAICCKLWLQTVFDPSSYKAWLILGSVLGPRILQMGAEWLSQRHLRQWVLTGAQRGPCLIPWPCLNCMRGLKKCGLQGLGKVPEWTSKSALFGCLLGSQIAQGAQEQSPFLMGALTCRFSDFDTVPPVGCPPPGSVNSGDPVGRTRGEGEQRTSHA